MVAQATTGMTMPTGDEIKLPLTSRDVNAERLAQFRELFPEAFAEGKFDLKKLALVLGESATDAPERYGLTWAGKSEAIRAIQTTSPGTLLPAPGESVNFDTSENVIIEGDNLETLKLLQGGYHGRVKMIYIDPPYNTGGEFIYPDNYREGLADYLKFSGQVSGEGIRLATNAETDGRYHSKWLTMIYPRLFLARNLLREDGVIFVSIDDHEVHNLRAVMNEIFGEENFVAQIIWKKRSTPPNDKIIGADHDYIFLFARNIQTAGLNLRQRSEEQIARYQNPDNHPKGPWAAGDLMANVKGGRYVESLNFPIRNPKTGEEHFPSSNGNWRFSRGTIAELITKNEIYFGEDGKGRPKLKRFYCDVKAGITYPTIWDFVPLNTEGSAEMAELLGSMTAFENPKPSGLLLELVKLGSSEDSVILDFFAGSGTTAQAVMELNAQDGGNRKFILVQLPEPTGRRDFATIADITKERIRRVIKKLKSVIAAKEITEHKASEGQLNLGSAGVPPAPSGVSPDTRPTNLPPEDFGATPKSARATCALPEPNLGFKVFKLSSSNFKVWDAAAAPKDGAALAEQLKLIAHNVEDGRPDDALLYELVLKCNLPLTSKIVVGKIGDQVFYDVAEGAQVICLARKLTQATLRGLMARKPKSIICLDIAFAGNDQLKANTVLEMKSHGIEFHTA
jgi:adenine-specific DNA-methyltransferase